MAGEEKCFRVGASVIQFGTMRNFVSQIQLVSENTLSAKSESINDVNIQCDRTFLFH